jgi:hypothetical protein
LHFLFHSSPAAWADSSPSSPPSTVETHPANESIECVNEGSCNTKENEEGSKDTGGGGEDVLPAGRLDGKRGQTDYGAAVVLFRSSHFFIRSFWSERSGSRMNVCTVKSTERRSLRDGDWWRPGEKTVLMLLLSVSIKEWWWKGRRWFVHGCGFNLESLLVCIMGCGCF